MTYAGSYYLSVQISAISVQISFKFAKKAEKERFFFEFESAFSLFLSFLNGIFCYEYKCTEIFQSTYLR